MDALTWYLSMTACVLAEDIRDAICLWQGCHHIMRSTQRAIATQEALDDSNPEIVAAIAVIDSNWQKIPEGLLLWHASPKSDWKYDADLWLPTSISIEGAWTAVRKGENVTFHRLKIGTHVWGFAAAADEEFCNENEVVLRHDAILLETGANAVEFAGQKFQVHDYELTGCLKPRSLRPK